MKQVCLKRTRDARVYTDVKLLSVHHDLINSQQCVGASDAHETLPLIIHQWHS